MAVDVPITRSVILLVAAYSTYPSEPTMAERKIEINSGSSVRELLRLLEIHTDELIVDVDGEPVRVEILGALDTSSISFEEKVALARSVLGTWGNDRELDELEQAIYDTRQNDPVRPPVVLD